MVEQASLLACAVSSMGLQQAAAWHRVRGSYSPCLEASGVPPVLGGGRQIAGANLSRPDHGHPGPGNRLRIWNNADVSYDMFAILLGQHK